MELVSLILFITYGFGIGSLAMLLVKPQENLLERLIMTFGIGLSIIPLAVSILGQLRLPIDWRLFLIVAVAGVISFFYSLSKHPADIKATKSTMIIGIVLIIFALTAFMYVKGAFAYAWLEDDDSWTHAMSMHYVANQESVREPVAGKDLYQYLDPYPPGYDGIMGLLGQTASSLQWTLKFFNAIIISCSILFFYFFSKEFLEDKTKALLATAVIASVPAFMSHFIWALSLLIPIFLVSLYMLEMVRHDRKYWILAALAISGVLLVQPTTAVKVGVMLAIYGAFKLLAKDASWKPVWAAIIAGLAISMVAWWIPAFVSGHAYQNFIGGRGDVPGFSLKYPGTADRPYSLSDFLFVSGQNMINNPVGLGLVACLLAAIGIIASAAYGRKMLAQPWIPITLAWLGFTFIGVEGAALPVQFFAFRFWMLIALPVSILAAEGTVKLARLSAAYNIPATVVYGICILGLLATSAQAKFETNTASWGVGMGFYSAQDVPAYIWMHDNLKPKTPVFGLCGMESAAHLIGFDMYQCTWCDSERDFSQSSLNNTAQQIHDWLRGHNYQYTMLDSSCVIYFGLNATNQRLQEMSASGGFTPAYSSESAIILKVA